jgi:O-antigen/teichoic acid export membrane protein
VILTKLRLHPFLTDVALTGAAQGGVLASNLICIGIVGHVMGVVALGEFLLVRRLCSWFMSGSQLGLGTALPREIARCTADVDVKARQYFVSAMGIVVLAVLLVTAACSADPELSAKMMLGNDNVALMYALLFLVLATVVHTMLMSYYVGLQRMRMANLFQIINNAALPAIVVAASAHRQSIVLVVTIASFVQLLVACVWSAPVVGLLRGIPFSDIIEGGRQLLNYGIRRVPADLAAGGLFTVGPVIAAHYVAPDKVGFLLLGTICLTSASMAFAPLSVVLLTKVSSLLGMGRTDDVKTYVGHLRSAVMHVSFLLVTQALIFANPVIRWWIGGSYHSAVPVMSVMILGVPGYMYFVALRTVIDAATPVAYNTRNVVASLVFLVVLTAGAVQFLAPEQLVIGIGVATTLTVWFLAFLTNRTLRILEMGKMETSLRPFFAAAVLGLVGLAVQFGTGFNMSKMAFSLTLALNCMLLAILMHKHQPDWMSLVGRRGLVRS